MIPGLFLIHKKPPERPGGSFRTGCYFISVMRWTRDPVGLFRMQK
jgi:hypothetical protein